MKKFNVREFTETDWYMLGGAERFDDGHEPFVADEFEYADIIVIADVNGLQIVTAENEYHLPIEKDNLRSWDSGLAEEFFRVFVGSIARLTDEEIISYCKTLGFRPRYDDKDTKTCPRCGRKYSEPPSISRKDNKTEICPACGVDEALKGYFDNK